MKSLTEIRKHLPRVTGMLALGVLSMFTPGVRGANPNGGVRPGVPIILPPFLSNPAPQLALQPVSPFAMIGFIQSATLDNGTPGTVCAAADPLCGGTVTVNGITVRVPRNTILQMPAFAISWADLFRSAPAPYGPTQTGLAITDTPKPFTTYEINIQGNRVVTGTGDQYIAALILMSQQSVNSAQGYINFIDYAPTLNGKPAEMWIGSTLAAKTGARVRINSPGGRYGTPDPLADARFTADEDNPTIRTETGYPMCLPRVSPTVGVDSTCPQWNRPGDPFTGAFAKIYTMGAAVAGPVGADGITHQVGYPTTQAVKPDPFEQAPFEVGDFVTYSGNLVNDVPCVAGLPLSSCQYVSANTVIASVGIYTAPGATPVYTAIESQLIGTGGTPNPLFPQEGVEKLVISAFTTDSTQLVDFFAVDVNPVTGIPSYRFYGTADPFGPPVSPLKGRARIRTFIGNYLPPTREMVAASRTLTGGNINVAMPLTANGLKGGYYRAPTFDFITPENFGVGNPQVPIPWEGFPFLVNGFGPYTGVSTTGAATTATVGQLIPWPDMNAPPAGNTLGLTLLSPPVPNAGFPQTVTSGSVVTLDGSASTDPNVPALTMSFSWAQSAGPTVSLLNVFGAKPQFTAPILPSGSTPVTLTFQLAVCNGFTCSGVSSVNITVVAATAGPTVTLGATQPPRPPATTPISAQNVLPATPVTLTATATGTGLTFTFAQTALGGLPAVALAGTGNVRTFTAPSAAQLTAAGVTLPVNLAFTVTVRDSAARTVTDTIHIFVGADTLTVPAAGIVYRLSKSVLTVTVSTNAPNGAAILQMTPLGITGLPLTAPVDLVYDPIANSYSIGPVGLAVNPTPNSVKITSSFGGTITSPIQLIR